MTDTDPSVTRRSVLKTTAAALGVGVGATGTAAAACNKVRIVNDIVPSYGSDYFGECVSGHVLSEVVEAGTEHYVYETCSAGDGVYYRIGCQPERWVPAGRHVECIDSATSSPECFEFD